MHLCTFRDRTDLHRTTSPVERAEREDMQETRDRTGVCRRSGRPGRYWQDAAGAALHRGT
jgi:hypothetical protein